MGFRMNKDDMEDVTNSFNIDDTNKQAFIKVFNYLATHNYEKMELNFENGSSMTIQICKPPVKIKLDDIVDEDEEVTPCKKKGCSTETIASCCGCPEFFDWERRRNNG